MRDTATRLAFAQAALDEHASDDTGDAPMIDLIADVLLLAEREGFDARAIHAAALTHFEHEAR